MGAQPSCCCSALDAEEQLAPQVPRAPAASANNVASAAAAEDFDAAKLASLLALGGPKAEGRGGKKEGDGAKATPLKAEQAAELRPTRAAAVDSGEVALAKGEIRVVIERQPEVTIGLNLDALDERATFVNSIMEGAIRSWSVGHPDEPRLMAYDRITAINGVRGSTNAILAEMRRSMRWSLAVQRPTSFRVTVDRGEQEALGLDLKYSPIGVSLLIAGIGDGAVHNFNAAQPPDRRILVNDRIVEINGRRGTAKELLAAATDVESLDLVVLNFAEG